MTMKGENTLELNMATMVAAMQLWANQTFTKAPTVKRVEQTAGAGQNSNHQKLFKVVVEEDENEPITCPDEDGGL